MRNTHAIADLLPPDDIAALVRAGFLAPDYHPRRSRARPQPGEEPLDLTNDERRWLEREVRQRPTGRYAAYIAGGPEVPQ